MARITIMIDDDLVKKIRSIQARRIKESKKSVSFSAVLSDLAESGIKNNK